MEKYQELFDNYVVEDKEHIVTIIESASIALKSFKIIIDEESDPIKTLGACFITTYKTILEYLKSKEVNYSSYEINMLDRLTIGYSNSTDENDEKNGNFAPYIKHNSIKHNQTTFEFDEHASARVTKWVIDNTKNNSEAINDICEMANKNLANIGVRTGNSQLILPIFASIYEAAVNYVTIKRVELDEVEFEINLMSCFWLKCIESTEGDEIYVQPNLADKTFIKDDNLASAKYE